MLLAIASLCFAGQPALAQDGAAPSTSFGRPSLEGVWSLSITHIFCCPNIGANSDVGQS